MICWAVAFPDRTACAGLLTYKLLTRHTACLQLCIGIATVSAKSVPAHSWCEAYRQVLVVNQLIDLLQPVPLFLYVVAPLSAHPRSVFVPGMGYWLASGRSHAQLLSQQYPTAV